MLRVWITLLARKNQHGEVFAAVPGLAHAARVSLVKCKQALERLQAPDPYSRTPEHEGRRIEVIPGGWFVLNHEKYRRLEDEEDRRARTAERVRRHRERHRNAEALQGVTGNPAVTRGNKMLRVKRHTDTDTDTRTTWLAPFLDIWEQTYGAGSGAAVAGRLATALHPLVAAHGADRVAAQLRNYVRQVEPEFANPQGFAQKFAAWKGKRGSRRDESVVPLPQTKVDPLVSEAVDQAAARPSKRLKGPLAEEQPHVKRKA